MPHTGSDLAARPFVAYDLIEGAFNFWVVTRIDDLLVDFMALAANYFFAGIAHLFKICIIDFNNIHVGRYDHNKILNGVQDGLYFFVSLS